MIRLRKVEKTIQTLCNWIIFLLFNNTEKYVDKTVSVWKSAASSGRIPTV